MKHVVSLHNGKSRKESGQFIVEGKRFVQEALLREAEIITIYYCPDNEKLAEGNTYTKQGLSLAELVEQAQNKRIPVEQVTESVMYKMATTKEPQRIIAVTQQQEYDWQDIHLDDNGILLIIDQIQDPGNLGTILRTALAADVKNIILTKGTVDLYNTKVLRSSMGAIFSLTIITDKTVEEITNYCKANNHILTVSAMEGTSIYEWKICEQYPLALVLGNEAFGPSDLLAQKADKRISIPMFNNVESLNVAIAAGIFLFELRRRLHFL